MAVVSLMSGGIDSAVMAKLLQENNEEVIPLYVDYGQLNAKKEWEACQSLCKELELKLPEKADVNGYGRLLPSGLTNETKDICEDAFLPGRNMLLLLLGSSFAYSQRVKTVSIGLLKGVQFPDQSENFVVDVNFTLNRALDYDLTIITPLIRFTKADVLALAKGYELPLEKTYSCHKGKEKYCRNCISCKEILNSGKADMLPQFQEGEVDGE